MAPTTRDPQQPYTRFDLEPFTRGYVQCALWLADPEPGSGPWQPHAGAWFEDIDPEWVRKAIADCVDFQTAQSPDLELYLARHNHERAGQDFYLSRNGHGAGFCDRGNAAFYGRLQEAAAAFGYAELCYEEHTEPFRYFGC